MRQTSVIGVASACAYLLSPTISHAVPEQRAFLTLFINLVPQGEALVILRPADVLISISNLQKAGLIITQDQGKRETIEGENYVSLSSLAPKFTYKLDEKALTLQITAPSNQLGSTVRNFRTGRPSDIIRSKDTSAFFNYSLNAGNLQNSSRTFSVFGEAGLSIRDSLLYSSFSRNTNGNFLRGLTYLTLDNPNSLNRWTIGDRFTQTGNLGGSPIIGGISFSRNFGLDPYFITTPQFGLQGALTTPSTVDIYSNGVLLRREQLPPGQFELRDLPVPTGSSTTSLVIHDAFGREQVISAPSYFSPGLLQRGLSDYSFNLGLKRNNLSKSFDYGSLAFLSRYRQGITNSLTAGVRLEGASNLVSGGGDMTVHLPFGDVQVEAAASSGDGFNGYAGLLGYSYVTQRFNVGASVRTFSPHYAHSSLSPTDDRSLLETNIQVGVPLGSRASLTAQYTASHYRDRGSSDRLALLGNIRLSAKASLFISASHANQTNRQRENTIFAGISYFFGNNTTANVSYQQQNNQGTAVADVERSLSTENGLGYHLQTSVDTLNGAQSRNNLETQSAASLQYQSSFGRYELDYNRTGDTNFTSLNVSGGVVLIGGKPFLTRPLDNSYALVRVPGVKGVRVYLNNNEVGRTNSSGDLLVTNLLPYYANRISIAGKDVPLDYKIAALDKNIAPPERSGAMVVFAVTKLRSFTGKILVEVGGKTTIPAYGQLSVIVDGQEVRSPIGRDGEFYLETLSPKRYDAQVQYEGGICKLQVDIPKVDQPVVNLGTLRCVAPSSKPE
jgi:outer membrane usher protein